MLILVAALHSHLQSETPNARHKHSFVHLQSNSTNSHQLASIKRLFIHTFVHTYQLALVEVYAKPHRDLETSIFFVKSNSTTLKIIQLDQVSAPHVTVTENDYIWFLDYKV